MRTCTSCGRQISGLAHAGMCMTCAQVKVSGKPRRPGRGMLRKRCEQAGFHEAHEWVHELNAADRVINGTLTVTTRLWCSGGEFTGPDEIEDYLGRPWSISDVENYLAG